MKDSENRSHWTTGAGLFKFEQLAKDMKDGRDSNIESRRIKTKQDIGWFYPGKLANQPAFLPGSIQ